MTHLQILTASLDNANIRYETYQIEDETVVSFSNDSANCDFCFFSFDGSYLRTELHANFYCD